MNAHTVVCSRLIEGGSRMMNRAQERLTRGIVISTMRRAARPSGCARCGAGAGCSTIRIPVSLDRVLYAGAVLCAELTVDR